MTSKTLTLHVQLTFLNILVFTVDARQRRETTQFRVLAIEDANTK